MKSIIKIISYLGLGLTIVPAFLVFYQVMTLELYKSMILLGTFVWLVSAPFWIFKKVEEQ